MYTDKALILSGGYSAANAQTFQTVSGAAAVNSTNVIDLQVARDMGEGQDLYARATVGTAFAGLTALRMDVVTAGNAALTTNVQVLASTGDVPVAQLTAGTRFALPLAPLIGQGGRRFIGIIFTPTGTGTAGTVFADIGIEVDDATIGGKAYASGFSVI